MNKNIPKRGPSVLVIILFFIALCSVGTAITLYKKQNTKSAGTAPSPSTTVSDLATKNTYEELFPIVDIPNKENTLVLQLEKRIVHLSAGGEAEYSYPQIIIKDNAELSDRINRALYDLTQTRIEPAVKQFTDENTPNATRIYSYELFEGTDHYSLVITLDMFEGITPAREIFAWNFHKQSGKFFTLQEDCSQPMALASLIDGSIENIASYDQIIHKWLTEVITSEYESSEFSFFFTENSFVAVLNKRLLLDNFDRDPILIEIPYDTVSSLFTQ